MEEVWPALMMPDAIGSSRSLLEDCPTPGPYPIRDIFQQFYPQYLDLHSVTDVRHRAANCIANCKTGELGYNASYCGECGHLDIHACACNNRNCPDCHQQ